MAGNEEQKTCGYCANFVQLLSELEGICRVIPGEKPGSRGKKVKFDTDGSQCSKFERIEEVRHYDVAQQGGWGDSNFYQMRSLDVFKTAEEKQSDRLIYEKRSKDEEHDDKNEK